MSLSSAGIETRMALVEKEIESIFSVFGKLETTLERISEVSGQLKEMIAVHEQRLLVQERTDTIIFEQIERRKDESTILFEKINSKIDDSIRLLREQLDNGLKEQYAEVRSVITESKESRKELTEIINARFEQQNTNREKDSKALNVLEGRINALERWRWMLVGGASIIGALIGSIPIWSNHII